jgi:hypothetical protein
MKLVPTSRQPRPLAFRRAERVLFFWTGREALKLIVWVALTAYFVISMIQGRIAGYAGDLGFRHEDHRALVHSFSAAVDVGLQPSGSPRSGWSSALKSASAVFGHPGLAGRQG